MQVIRFSCPSCAAELRIRDEDLIGRPIACPDCRQLLLLSRDESGEVLVERADQQTAAVKRAAKTPATASVDAPLPKPKPPAKEKFIARWRAWLASGGLQKLSPSTTTWVAAASIGAAVVVFLAMGIGLWWRSSRPVQNSTNTVADNTTADDGRKPSEATKKDPLAVAALTPAPPAKKKSPPRNGEQKAVTVVRPLTSPKEGANSGNAANVAERSGSTTHPAADVSDPSEKIAARAPVVASRPIAKPPGPPAAKPKVDIAAGLRQRIVRFEQQKPVPLRDLVEILEEMVAVPIRGNTGEIADLDLLLQTPVAFDLQNTTAGDVLKAILAKGKLRFEVEPDEIRLRRLADSPADGP